jgi:Flp pilus assembly protein TadG
MRARLRVARGDDEGTALIEFIWLGLLLLIPLAYVVISLFSVQRSAFAVSAATRAAGRAWVSAPAGTDRDQRAQLAAHLVAQDQGVSFDDDALTFSCSRECCPGTGTLHVRLTVDATLPGLAALDRKAARIPVTGRHDEVIDQFATAPEGCP